MASWIAHEPFGPLIEPNPRPRHTALLGVAFVSALMGVLSLSSVEVAPPAVQGSVLSSSSGPAAVAAPMLGGEVALGVTGASSAVAEAPPEILEVRPFDRQLIGTAASPQRASSQALFRRPGASSSDLFRVGDRIDGYRVARIEPRTVTLVDPSGQQWVSRVPLYPDDAPVVEAVRPSVEAPIVDPEPDSTRTAGEASAASQTAAESPGDSTLRIRRGLFRRLVSRGLAPDSRLVARRDDAGETTGYAVTVTQDSIAERLGLENGDVVVAVGGLAASEIPNVNDVLGVMRDEREVCFDIERRGVVFDLCYRPR